MSSSTFKLDPNIFNATLYKSITDLWFLGIDTSGQEIDMSIAKRWFAGTPEERRAFDAECRAASAHALEAIGPEAFPEAHAQPFLDEIARVAEREEDKTGEQAAWTALSLTLLLDQMPRNLYRTHDELRKVYNHYDRMAYSLVRSLLSPDSPIPRPDTHPVLRLSGPHRFWFYLPLVHSEDIAAHDLADESTAELARDVEGLEGYKGTKMFLESSKKSAKEHRDILELFGRYPHRNGALGRQSTDEEKKFMDEGGATFGVGQQKKESTT